MVGIDDYTSGNGLCGCVNDANAVGSLLSANQDGSPNFNVRYLLDSEVSANKLNQYLKQLFEGEADTVLFYFAGHGIFDEHTDSACLVTNDGQDPNWGLHLDRFLHFANRVYPKIKSTVAILDCCGSGYAGELAGMGTKGNVSFIGKGITILTACDRQGNAEERDGHGVFSSLILDGLRGQAADILGRITPAALYAHVDQTLGVWGQRPIYKTNVQQFISLRQVSPRIDKTIIRKLPEYFPTQGFEFPLDPSCEPNRGSNADTFESIPVNEEKKSIYRDLQSCNRQGLVVPVSHQHMWDAAVYSGTVKLTDTGIHYRRLAEQNLI